MPATEARESRGERERLEPRTHARGDAWRFRKERQEGDLCVEAS